MTIHLKLPEGMTLEQANRDVDAVFGGKASILPQWMEQPARKPCPYCIPGIDNCHCTDTEKSAGMQELKQQLQGPRAEGPTGPVGMPGPRGQNPDGTPGETEEEHMQRWRAAQEHNKRFFAEHPPGPPDYAVGAPFKVELYSDSVDHPAHYGGADNPYEAIKVIEAWGLGFNLGNTLKYIARAGKKCDRDADLKKALWYLNRELENLSK